MAIRSLARGYNRTYLALRIFSLRQIPRTFATSTNMASSISDAIKQDHREIEDYYNKILSATDSDSKIRWQNQFTWELARHSIAEELVVYPLFEKELPDGKAMADKDRDDHNQVKVALKKFQSLSPDQPEFESTLKDMWKTLSKHIEEEETSDLVQLEDSISKDDSEKTAKSFQRTKMFVPTRSHPSAPDKPPFETAAGLLAAPMDKLMDMFSRFPK